MGKVKRFMVAVMVVSYFFLGLYSGLYSRMDLGQSPALMDAGSHGGSYSEWTSGGYHLHGASILGQGLQEAPPRVILIDQSGQWYYPNTTVTLPEGSKVRPYFLNISIEIGENTTNVTIPVINFNGENVSSTEWISLEDIGVFHLEVVWENVTYRWELNVISQEAYQAQQAANVEPAYLRLKALLVGAIAMFLSIPIGAYLKRRHAGVTEL